MGILNNRVILMELREKLNKLTKKELINIVMMATASLSLMNGNIELYLNSK